MKLRLLLLLLIALLPLACGKKLDQQLQESVRQFDGLELPRKQVEIVEVQESGDFAIAELRVSTAAKLRKENGRWVIDEIRLGDRRWEKAATILAALRTERENQTHQTMQRLAVGIEEYREKEGKPPAAESFEALVDLLAPDYLAEVIRLDAWARPFEYRLISAQQFELRSAGSDGVFQTEDDLVWSKP